MALVRDEPDTFGGLIAATAERLQLDPALVEKDYWAVQALRAARAGIEVPLNGAAVVVLPVFKGGTSLSKAFGLIERFSEDVDLLVPLPVSDPAQYSNNQRSEVMKAVTAAVGEVLGIAGERKAGRRGVDCHWLYPYESVTTTALEVKPHIVVELTVMGGQNPQTQKDVISMVAEQAAATDGFPDYEASCPSTRF